MYLPAFSRHCEDLHTNSYPCCAFFIQFLLEFLWGNYCMGHCLTGLGVKNLCTGLSVYSIASLGCVLIHSANGFNCFAIVTGAFGGWDCGSTGFGNVIFFLVSEKCKIFSFINAGNYSVSPLIAPTLGGYVTATIGWQYIFNAYK